MDPQDAGGKVLYRSGPPVYSHRRQGMTTREATVLELIRTMSSVQMAVRQVAVFGASFLIASLFYRFGSFALEAVAFLATWLALDIVAHVVDRTVTGARATSPQDEMA
jgi:hypothetical protein